MAFLNTLFFLSTFLIFLSSISLVSTKNIMHSCIFLLGSLIGVAGLYVTLGADFVAAAQIMVYVGGIVILMLFAVMLTGGKDFVSRAQALMGLVPSMGSKFTYGLGLLTALVLAISTGKIFLNLRIAIPTNNVAKMDSTVAAIGRLLVTNHVLAFELSSVLLLGALIGAAIIARPKKIF
ncbi:MAG: NADH-quinone oxidoreductase subunit J [Bacteriovoracaceae bacterium]